LLICIESIFELYLFLAGPEGLSRKNFKIETQWSYWRARETLPPLLFLGNRWQYAMWDHLLLNSRSVSVTVFIGQSNSNHMSVWDAAKDSITFAWKPFLLILCYNFFPIQDGVCDSKLLKISVIQTLWFHHLNLSTKYRHQSMQMLLLHSLLIMQLLDS